MKIDHDEFQCAGCGQYIISLPAQDPPPTRCATCTWMNEFVHDPAERAAIIVHLKEIG